VVYQLRASTHQCLTRADYGQVSLGTFAPVPEWVQQLRIHSSQASQVLGVDLIGFTLVGVDETQFTGIGHQYLVATPLEQTANPGRVGSCLDGYTQRLLRGEAPPQSLRGSAQPAFLHHLAALLIDEAQG
jgi:hypothetical protein